MTAREEIVIRVDATVAPGVAPGEQVQQGQPITEGVGRPVFPISGTIRSVRFDGDAHEFIIILVPNTRS